MAGGIAGVNHTCHARIIYANFVGSGSLMAALRPL